MNLTPLSDSPNSPAPTDSQLVEMRRAFATRLRTKMRNSGLDHKAIEKRSVQLYTEGKVTRGINRTVIYKYLEGVTLPTPATLEVLAAVFTCKPEDLLPAVATTPLQRGRRRINRSTAYVAIKSAGPAGLEKARLQIDCILPAQEAHNVYRLFRQLLRSRGMEVTPEGVNDSSRTPLTQEEVVATLKGLVPQRVSTHKEAA